MTNGSEESLEARRKRLDAELASIRAGDAADAAHQAREGESRRGMAQALKISSEFIGGIAVGVLLGYLVDLLGTSPWGLIIGVLLGFCAGVLNVLRSVGMVAQPEPFRGDRSNDKGDDGV